MTSSDIFSTRSIDRQLIEIAIELKSTILANGEDIRKGFSESQIEEIYRKAKIWDRVFQASLSPRKGE